MLRVPTALVSMVDRRGQVFPGAVGLPEPWQQQRATPLSHSFCQHVVARKQSLVVSDAVSDPLVATSQAIADLGVIAYAGVPIADHDGTIVGSLCAIDSVARDWTQDELADLHELAAICSAELASRQQVRERASASERARVARELHDHVVWELLSLSMELKQNASVASSTAQLLSRIDELVRTIHETVFADDVDS